MTTTPAAIVAMVVLSAAGLLPVAALVGRRVIAVPLCPLAGSVIAALAATGFTALGGTFVAWFVAVAAVAALAAIGYWVRWPDRRPWRRPVRVEVAGDRWCRLLVGVSALVVLGTCIWSLRGLATPTVGFDARAVWLMRAGWFLQSHHQMLVNLRVSDVTLIQTPYPPLVSAAAAVAWRVTGDHSMRLGVVVIALLNTCALATAAFALVESGRHFTHRLLPERRAAGSGRTGRRAPSGGRWLSFAPLVVGMVAASLLVVVAFGITEPFMTNGYADPIWSLAALGAVAYGLQMGTSRTNRGAALILVVVAGMSKNEGVATAAAIIVLVALRGVVSLPAAERRRQWWRPVVIGVAALMAVASWPLLMRVIHARGETSTLSPAHEWPDRARAAYDGMAPYLHVILLAALLAVVGGLVLSRVRRRSGLANDVWAWAGLASGLVVVGGAYVTSTAVIAVWLIGTVDRVTEFPALAAWWIVAMWAVVASGAPATLRFPERRHSADPASEAGIDSDSDSDSDSDATGDPSSRGAPTPVGVAAG